MRKQRNGEDTRTRVLAAAEEIFAQHGFSGSSLAMISARSGISDGLILHHFHNKQNLYHEVLENLADRYSRALSPNGELSSQPQIALRQALTTVFNYWQQDTTYQRISMWAYLENQADLVEKETALTAQLARAVATLQAQGMIPASLSPLAILPMIIGPIQFWLRYRSQFQQALNLTGEPDEFDRQFLEQFITLVARLANLPAANNPADAQGK
jgi:TetR/AcrR family transcriptional regulator